MIDIGLVGLDTSHAEQFAELLRNRNDTNVGGVWDSGDVRDDRFVERFCEEYQTPLYDEPTGMIDTIDAVMVLTVDWDRHRPISERYLEAGVPTFIDKPIAGTVIDIESMRRVVRREGTPLFGGSAVPYHPSLETMRADRDVHDLFSAGFNGPFYYGVHLTDTVRRICGSDWCRIEPTPHPATTTVMFEDGSNATLRFDGPTEDAAFGLLDIGQTIRTAYIGESEDELERMYEPFIDAFVETIRRDRDESDRLLDAATLVLGVQAVLKTGRVVKPDSATLYDVDEDGTAFADVYEPLY